MKILITGYTGFLGSNLVQFFREKKHKIIKFNLRKLEKIDKKYIFLKLKSYKNISIIINCAANLNPKDLRDFHINQKIPSILEEYSCQNNIKFIHISTINTIIQKRLDKYSVSKKIAEQKLKKKYSTVIRLSLIIKKKRKKILDQGEVSFIFKYLYCLKLPFYPFIYPGNIYKPLEISDICEAINKLIYEKKNKFVNLYGKYILNSFDLFKLICDQENKKYFKINISWIKKTIPNYIQNYLCKSRFFQQILCVKNI